MKGYVRSLGKDTLPEHISPACAAPVTASTASVSDSITSETSTFTNYHAVSTTQTHESPPQDLTMLNASNSTTTIIMAYKCKSRTISAALTMSLSLSILNPTPHPRIQYTPLSFLQCDCKQISPTTSDTNPTPLSLIHINHRNRSLNILTCITSTLTKQSLKA